MSSGFKDDPDSEQAFALKRARHLESRRLAGKFDAKHLKAIHKDLFQDVFPWAGEFRVVNISKGNSPFGPALHIDAALNDAVSKLQRESLLAGMDQRTRYSSRTS